MPKPTEGETKEHFMERCISMRHNEKSKESNDQSIAICFSIWREAHPKDKSAKKPEASEEEAKKKKKKQGAY